MHSHIKIFILFACTALITIVASSQLQGSLKKGTHNVGFKILNVKDDNGKPFQICLWYPAKEKGTVMKIKKVQVDRTSATKTSWLYYLWQNCKRPPSPERARCRNSNQGLYRPTWANSVFPEKRKDRWWEDQKSRLFQTGSVLNASTRLRIKQEVLSCRRITTS